MGLILDEPLGDVQIIKNERILAVAALLVEFGGHLDLLVGDPAVALPDFREVHVGHAKLHRAELFAHIHPDAGVLGGRVVIEAAFVFHAGLIRAKKSGSKPVPDSAKSGDETFILD